MATYKETADDLARKYHQTFILYDKKLAFIHHFVEMDERPGDRIGASLSTAKGEEHSIIVDPSLIEPIAVNAMFINHAIFAEPRSNLVCPLLLVCRKPKRQWRRGLCMDNTAIRNPLQSLYNAINKVCLGVDVSLSWPLLQRILNPTYPALADACTLVSTYIGVAISPMFAITLSNISPDKFLLLSTFGIIGQCTPNHIWVHHQPALQEVRDYITRTNQSVEIELAHA